MAETAAIPSEKYVRVATAAARLDCYASTLKELIFRGELAAVRFGTVRKRNMQSICAADATPVEQPV